MAASELDISTPANWSDVRFIWAAQNEHFGGENGVPLQTYSFLGPKLPHWILTTLIAGKPRTISVKGILILLPRMFSIWSKYLDRALLVASVYRLRALSAGGWRMLGEFFITPPDLGLWSFVSEL